MSIPRPNRRPKGSSAGSKKTGGQFSHSSRPDDPQIADYGPITADGFGGAPPTPQPIPKDATDPDAGFANDPFAQWVLKTGCHEVVLYDDDGKLYDEDGAPLPDDFSPDNVLQVPYRFRFDEHGNRKSPSPPVVPPASAFGLPDTDGPFAWPPAPREEDDDIDLLTATSEEVACVRKWMQTNHDTACRRFDDSDVAPQDDTACIRWADQDPYFGPIIRGLTGLSAGDEMMTAMQENQELCRVVAHNARGARFHPSVDEWKWIYDEMPEGDKVASVAVDA